MQVNLPQTQATTVLVQQGTGNCIKGAAESESGSGANVDGERDGQNFHVQSTDYLVEQFAGLNISRDLEFEDDGFATRSLDWFHESFQGLYNMYYSKYGTNQTQSTSGGGSSSGVTRDPYARLLQGLTQHKKKKSRGDPTMSSEYEQYLKTDFVSGLQPKDFASYDVWFWKSKENQFPVLSRMAMDILSVQASSVASESAFSTSGRLLTIRRTRLTPESLEMCMCLKDHLDAHERKQNTSPLELPLDVEEGVFNDEVQQNEATQLTDQEIALDASSDGSLSSGERRRDYMMSSGAEDDQTGEGGSMSHGSITVPEENQKGAVMFGLIWGVDKLEFFNVFRCPGMGGRYIEKDAKSIVMQTLSVAAFTHLQGAVHHDLKPEAPLGIRLRQNYIIERCIRSQGGGQDESSQLLKAIEESEIYAVVLSINYAHSVGCLDELVLIMDCLHKFKRRKVFPILFNVNPSDARSQQGVYAANRGDMEASLDMLDQLEAEKGFRPPISEILEAPTNKIEENRRMRTTADASFSL
ncbi:zinc finger BED domain-containing protein RICESLEEPER 2 [Tanacetum coccineum]